jgi:deazaflavin-dependent oxidoreductase (nitroreductase family)
MGYRVSLVTCLNDTQSLAREQFCYLTTVGRRTGRPHTIEIWFAASPDGRTLYMLAGGGERADWVKNIRHDPATQVRIGSRTYSARGRILTTPEEELTARRLVVAKYYGREYDPNAGWEATSLPVALDLVD